MRGGAEERGGRRSGREFERKPKARRGADTDSPSEQRVDANKRSAAERTGWS